MKIWPSGSSGTRTSPWSPTSSSQPVLTGCPRCAASALRLAKTRKPARITPAITIAGDRQVVSGVPPGEAGADQRAHAEQAQHRRRRVRLGDEEERRRRTNSAMASSVMYSLSAPQGVALDVGGQVGLVSV